MIKLEHVVLASPEQMEFIIEGMRNPMNSWEKSDSGLYCPDKYDGYIEPIKWKIGDNDHSLMQRLTNAGIDHRKFMRMMPVYVRITAPLYWWKEFDTYKVGTVANSCSTMHKIHEKEFTLEDFSTEHLISWTDDWETPIAIDKGHTPDGYPKATTPKGWMIKLIELLNEVRENFINYEEYAKQIQPDLLISKKDIWWQMIQLLPSSYNQTRNVMMNYEVLTNIYKSRKTHKLDEWRELCSWIESLPYSELITGKAD